MALYLIRPADFKLVNWKSCSKLHMTAAYKLQVLAVEDADTKHQVLYVWDGSDATAYPNRYAMSLDLITLQTQPAAR